MTKDAYLKNREALMNEAQTLIDAGKVDEASKKRVEIESLDSKFEAEATETANLNALKENKVVAPVASNFVTEEKMNHTKSNYREAFFKALMGKELNQSEKLAFDSGSSSAGAAIPEETANEIIRKLKERAPLLNEITLLQVEGNVKFAIEGVNGEAEKHTENAEITPLAETLVEVNLSGYEIVKLIQVSDTVSTMSINAFENWLVDMLVEAIADKITRYMITGTGSGEPQGIEKANTWGDTNSVTVANKGTLTAANVQTLIGLLGAGYDPNAKFLMSKKTLFTDFMPLQDNAKYDIVTREGRNYYVYGYPVMLDSGVADHEAYLGDFKKIVANLAEAINMKSGFDIDTNSNKYLGVAIFDSKVALGEAFVKLVKAGE